MTTVIDIETGPAPDGILDELKPVFEANKTLKDPDKIVADLKAKEAAWRERVALSPLTGQILAVGLLGDEGEQILTGTEAGMLETVWKLWDEGARFCGFNVKEFDFRFAVVRSRILSVPVPPDLFQGRYWNSQRIVDLMEVFCCFSRDTSGYNLDAICKACGMPGKLPGMTGADFARVFAEDMDKALEYCRNDLRLTSALATRLGIV